MPHPTTSNFGRNSSLKEDFAVGHIIVRLDGQNAVMGKPHAALAVKEWMAVGTADRAVGGQSKMDDAVGTLLALLYGLGKVPKRKSLAAMAVAVGKADAVAVIHKDGF